MQESPGSVGQSYELVKDLLLVALPFVTSGFLLLVVRPGATSSVLSPSSDKHVQGLMFGQPRETIGEHNG